MKIRVVLNVESGNHPELYNDLSRIKTRGRAARIRFLSTMGIAAYGRNPVLNPSDISQKVLPDRLVQPSQKNVSEYEAKQLEVTLAQIDEASPQEAESDAKKKERMERANRILKKLSQSLESL